MDDMTIEHSGLSVVPNSKAIQAGGVPFPFADLRTVRVSTPMKTSHRAPAAVLAENQRCIEHVKAIRVGRIGADLWLEVLIIAMSDPIASTVAAERERCVGLVAAHLFGDEPPGAPIRMLMDAIKEGEPAH